MTPNATARPRTIADRRAALNPPAAALAAGAALAALAAGPAAGAPAAAAPAAAADVYTVSGVEVDRTAATAAEAREVAIAAAHRSAFGRLVRRLVPSAHRPRVPELGAERIAPLVLSFAIDTEKASSVRYLAAMTFRFARGRVRALLRSSGADFAETPSKPVLVLPVYSAAGALSLWERPNPWLDAWRALPTGDGLVPVVLPDGGLADIRDLGARQALAGDRERVAAVAGRYGAASAVVAAARFRTDLGTGRRALEVSLRPFDGGPLVLEHGGDRAAALAAGAGAALDALGDAWKRRNLLDAGTQGRIVAYMALAGLDEWVGVRGVLRSVGRLRSARLVAVSRRAAAVRLDFYGTVGQLRLALAQRDLELELRGGVWSLRRAPAPPPG